MDIEFNSMNVKKVLVVTYYNNGSYGAALQAWALQHALTDMGFYTQILQYEQQYPLKPRLMDFLMSRSLKSIRNKLRDCLQRRMTHEFALKFLHESADRYRNFNEVKRNPPQADAYICGSDQIWNDWRFNEGKEVDLTYFLDFGDSHTRRIAYAASFGKVDLQPQFVSQIRAALQRFDAIGVREQASVNVARRISGKNVACVLDPTLLLRPYEYTQISATAVDSVVGDFSVIVIGSPRSSYEQAICELQRRTGGGGAVVFPLEEMGGKMHLIEPSVPAWLRQIQGSRFVLTDSFHATVFAILFHRPFAVVPRSGGGGGRNVRLINLLSMLGLERRFLPDTSASTFGKIFECEIDWKNVDRQLDILRGESFQFLKRSLADEIGKDAQ